MSSEATAALAWAEQAHALVRSKPRQARALAEKALSAAVASGDITARVGAANALGWAQTVLGDNRSAARTWRAGIRAAEKHGYARGSGILRRQLAVSLVFAGKSPAATREMSTALALLTGEDRAHTQVHRIAVHRRTFAADEREHRQVIADAGRALRLFRRGAQEIWEARLLYNLGLLRVDRGELTQARTDLERARMLYARNGAPDGAADSATRLAEIDLREGDVVECLKAIGAVEAAVPDSETNFNLEECRMMALAQARLLPEAKAAATEYAALCSRSGRLEGVAETKLDLSAIALMSGDTVSARRHALSAERSFAARDKPVNAALARIAVLRAAIAAGQTGRSVIASGLTAAETLDRAGWRRDALRARLLVAQAATRRDRATASEQLVLAAGLRTRGTAVDRIELARTRAQLLAAERKPAAAQRELEHGLALLDDYRAALGAVELRATASGIGAELAEAGLRIALDSRQPKKVLAWAERMRASALRLPNVRPPTDVKLQKLQVELRRAVSNGASAQQARLEAAIRSRSRLVEPDSGAEAAIPDARTAALLLGERVLVEYAELDGSLYALTLAGGRLELHGLSADAISELEWLRFALGRLAHGGSASQRAAARGNAEAAAAALDGALVAPLLPIVGDAALVVVPTGVLHALPWAALPSLRGRPLVVTPSLAIWARLAQLPRSRQRKTALIAGPRLRHAAAEVKELAGLRGHAHVLSGKEATAKATLAALDGAALAHLACHGHFRSDSPLFSSLELADGPLNVYELQTLRRAPEIVVLSACDVALSALHPGDELLGLAAALLGMGTRTIVASVVPVPDAAARRLMLALHRELLEHRAPAAALAHAQARTTVAGFVCLGSG